MGPTTLQFIALLAGGALIGVVAGVTFAVTAWWLLSRVSDSLSAWIDHDEGGGR